MRSPKVGEELWRLRASPRRRVGAVTTLYVQRDGLVKTIHKIGTDQ
jgi:hypothetical protein